MGRMRQMGHNGRRIGLGILSKIAILAAGAAGGEAGSPKETTPAIRVESVVITLIEKVQVPAQEAGVLAAVRVREGQFVSRGELLAQIDDTEAKLQEKRAQIELENARKQTENRISLRFAEKSREVAAAELKRATDSLDRYPKSISDTEVDRLRLSAEKAALAVDQAAFDVDVAQFALRLRQADHELAVHHAQRCKVTAPLGGVVAEIHSREGEWVKPADPVLRILRLDRLRAEGFLNLEQARADMAGWPAVFNTTQSNQEPAEFTGKIVFVSPEVSPLNGQLLVWAEIENPDLLLRPGMRGTLTLGPAPASQPVAAEGRLRKDEH